MPIKLVKPLSIFILVPAFFIVIWTSLLLLLAPSIVLNKCLKNTFRKKSFAFSLDSDSVSVGCRCSRFCGCTDDVGRLLCRWILFPLPILILVPTLLIVLGGIRAIRYTAVHLTRLITSGRISLIELLNIGRHGIEFITSTSHWRLRKKLCYDKMYKL